MFPISKLGTGANSDPEKFEHCSEWQDLKLAFRSIFCESQDFKALKLLLCRRASLFSFWAIGIVVFRTLYFRKNQEPNFLVTRDNLFEMKLTLSSAASSLYASATPSNPPPPHPHQTTRNPHQVWEIWRMAGSRRDNLSSLR